MASENGANVRSIATWDGIEHDQPRSLSSPDIRKSSQLRRQAVEVEGKAGEGKSKGARRPLPDAAATEDQDATSSSFIMSSTEWYPVTTCPPGSIMLGVPCIPSF